MHSLIHLFEKHPPLVGISICAMLVIMLIRSVIRAFQRWEILPDPLMPAWFRRIWYGIEKSAEDAIYTGLSGRKPD